MEKKRRLAYFFIFVMSCLSVSQVALADPALAALNQLTHSHVQLVPTVVGDPKGDITLIEFTDFNCSYCKVMSPIVNKLIASDNKLRVVIVDYPIITPSSAFAAKAALAAREQNKYLAFHDALMAHKGPIQQETIFTIAKQIGLNLKQFKAAINSEKTNALVANNLRLGFELGIPGTPTFIIARTLTTAKQSQQNNPQPMLSFGHVSLQALKAAIAKMRSAS